MRARPITRSGSVWWRRYVNKPGAPAYYFPPTPSSSCLFQAYAKAHGSYHAISGGHISEAMLDLTGAPTETIWMDHPDFDSEVTWARLLSFVHEGFPIGCASAFGCVCVLRERRAAMQALVAKA